jgi:hypothetical protein
MDAATNPFWMVYGIGEGAPTARHDTEASAIAEASRLARNNPGVTFCVLAATHAVVKHDVEVRRIDQDFAEVEPLQTKPWGRRPPRDGDDIPF